VEQHMNATEQNFEKILSATRYEIDQDSMQLLFGSTSIEKVCGIHFLVDLD
jgi:hypothetical protein